MIGERILSTVDLELQAMQGSEEAETIGMIRMGMQSKEKQLRATACEALHGLSNKRVGRALAMVIESPEQKTRSYFPNINQVLVWCMERNDPWLNQCAQASRQALLN